MKDKVNPRKIRYFKITYIVGVLNVQRLSTIKYRVADWLSDVSE